MVLPMPGAMPPPPPADVAPISSESAAPDVAPEHAGEPNAGAPLVSDADLAPAEGVSDGVPGADLSTAEADVAGDAPVLPPPPLDVDAVSSSADADAGPPPPPTVVESPGEALPAPPAAESALPAPPAGAGTPISALIPSAPVPADAPPGAGVPPEAAIPLGVVDPYGLAPFVAQISAQALRASRNALGILSAILTDGETITALVAGVYQSQPAVAALTSKRLVLVNEHEWKPVIREVTLAPDLTVQGLQDERTASLTFITDGMGVTISSIQDRPLAHEMARLVRERVAP